MKPLNPIMAVLVIASVGASPLRTLAADGTSPAGTTGKAEEKNPVNALSAILAANPTARADAGKRIEDFLLATVDGKSYVAPGADTKALGDVARAWGESVGPVGSVAVLYFVVGPGLTTPGWALKDPLLSKTFIPGMKWEGKLRFALAAAAPKGPDWTGKNQIKKKLEKKQATAFLNDAATRASEVFSDPRTKEELDLSINANNTTAPAVPTPSHVARTGLTGASQQYTLDDLYVNGAKVIDVAGDGDGSSRKISMKIYTKRLPTGEVINEIGIFDITDRSDIFGQRFPIDARTQSFILDDRTEGHKKYTLKFGDADEKTGDRTIDVGRGEKGGTRLTTSVSDLYIKRADQASDLANIVNINGEEFYTLPQGGSRSGLMMFPKALIDGRAVPGEDARKLIPSLYAEVGFRGNGGANQNVEAGPKKGPQFGTVGDKEFHLEFNKATGVWEVVEGAGDLPAAPKPAAADGKTPAGDGSTPADPNTTVPAGGASIADLEKLLMATGNCKLVPEFTKDLKKELIGKYGLVSCKDPDEIKGNTQVLLVPPGMGDKQQMPFGNIAAVAAVEADPKANPPVEGRPATPMYKLERARLYDHYIILEFDRQIQYRDLLKDTPAGLDVAGFVVTENKSGQSFKNSDIFLHAMQNYMGYKDATAIKEIPLRAAATVKGKPYNLNGAYTGGVFTVIAAWDGQTRELWPKLQDPGATDAKPNPYSTLTGPANAKDGEGSVASTNEDFPLKEPLADSQMAQRITSEADAKGKGAALYESVDLLNKKDPKKYFVMYRFFAMDAKDPAKPDGEKEKKVFRQRLFEVFNSTSPLPQNVNVQGLLLDDAPIVKSHTDSGYRFISGSTKAKGVVAVVQQKSSGGDNQQNPALNCVGPVVWWGLTRPEALKACQADKL